MKVILLDCYGRELCEWRDSYKCDCTFLDKVECKTIIDFMH